MDTDASKDVNGNGCMMNNHKPLVAANSSLGGEKKGEDHHANGGENDSDFNSFLPPQRGGMSRNSGNRTRRKVQWNDKNGNKLVEVLEYEPSDVSDSDDEDSDSCICTIM